MDKNTIACCANCKHCLEYPRGNRYGDIDYMYDDMTIVHWIPQTIIAGIIVILLVARVGIVDYNDTKVEKSIENTITANYDNIINYHNDENNKTFISSNSKYTFEYNENTKMLVVLKGSGVDAVFVDGVKQKGEK